MVARVDYVDIGFAWEGPNTWRGGIANGGLEVREVNLIFKGAERIDVSVHIPPNINPDIVTKFPFTCRRYHETEMTLGDRKSRLPANETNCKLLKVGLEQIKDLTIRAGFFEKGRSSGAICMTSSTGNVAQLQPVIRSDRDINLEAPKKLGEGQVYTLFITSDDLDLSAKLIRETEMPPVVQKEKAANREGAQNLGLASGGGAHVSSEADAYAHEMQGVVRADQEMHSGIGEPVSKPSESPSELDKLPIEELQSRFEATFIQDKKFEVQRMKAARAGNREEVKRIIQPELENGRLLCELAKAIERKGVRPQIPQTENFQSAERQSRALHDDALRNLEESCKMQ